MGFVGWCVGARQRARVGLLAVVSLAVLGVVAAPAVAAAAAPAAAVAPHTRGVHPGKGASGGPLIDHGGPVLTSSKTYAIFWGPPSAFASDLQGGIETLLGGFTNSSYLGIANQYMRGATATTTFAGNLIDTSAPPRKAPTPKQLAAEAAKLTGSVDPSAIYFVYTSNFPSNANYCAWHAPATVNGITTEVAYLPSPPAGCSPYTVANLGANSYSVQTVSQADSTAHEFMESVTDPQINAWYDAGSAELADKCNSNYQSVVTLPNGSSWQIQSEWSNAINGCQQQ